MTYHPNAWSRSSALASHGSFILELRRLALAGLPRMWRPEGDFYAFRVRRYDAETVREGISRRYTAIAAIGLATETEPDRTVALGSLTLRGLTDRLIQDVAGVANLGDVALTVWASAASGHGDLEAAADHLRRLRPDSDAHPTVEVAWSLAALCVAATAADTDLRGRLASRLIESLGPSDVFPHLLGGGGGLRSHVSCFADMVYPIQALALYHRLVGDRPALQAAERAADVICRHQGPAGQWWWHYDCRTGSVLEGYPVYAVHQDAMAPMALFALAEASGTSADLLTACDRCRDALREAERLLLFNALYDVAAVDGAVTRNELALLDEIGRFLGLTEADRAAARARFVEPAPSGAYAVLGVGEAASNDEVKSAFRKLAARHHPDKVAHLGQKAMGRAAEKFYKIREAYDEIRAARGF